MRELILLVLFGVDVLITYIGVFCLRKKFPRYKDWIGTESNPFVRICWRKFGLHKGTLISFFIILPLFLFIIFTIKMSENNILFGFLLGAYYIVFLNHYNAFRDIYKKK